MFRFLSPRMIAVLLATVALCGCRPADPITRVVVDADQSGVNLDGEAVSSAESKPARMIVAIHKAPTATWTFKVSGLLDLVNESEQACLEFFRGVQFAGGLPVLDPLPEGWSPVEVSPGPFAPFARLQVADGLTMSISKLPSGFDMLSNVNRWRGQLSLQPTQELDLSKLSIPSKAEFEIFDVVGAQSGSSGMMTPPFAGGGMARRPQPADSEIGYLPPPGWEIGRTTPMVAARLSKSVDEKLVQITVVKLPAKLNVWSQVSRNWAGEVGMESLTDDEMAERTSEVMVGTLKGMGIRLVSDKADSRALIGFRTVKDDNAWFVKLRGDRDLVVENEKDFVAFAKSIRFK